MPSILLARIQSMSIYYRGADAAEIALRVEAVLKLRLRGVARRLSVAVQGGIVTLTGEVPTYFDRQLACESSRRVPGVDGVRDEITVEGGKEMRNEVCGAPTVGGVAIGVRPGFAAVVVLFAMALVGCGGEGAARLPVHPVEGVVTRDGKPLANALVALHPKTPQAGHEIAPRAQTDANGQFKVTTYDTNDGAPEGEYAVTVQYYQLIQNGTSSEPGPNVLSPKISLPSTTDIVVKVASGPNKLAPIEVGRR
jgi:hypothetical protein